MLFGEASFAAPDLEATHVGLVESNLHLGGFEADAEADAHVEQGHQSDLHLLDRGNAAVEIVHIVHKQLPLFGRHSSQGAVHSGLRNGAGVLEAFNHAGWAYLADRSD